MDNPELADGRRREFLAIIVKESERLTRLINQVLDHAKMDAGRMEWRMADVEPAGSIEEALAATGGLIGNRPIRIEVDVPEGLPTVRADRDRLIQVIVNLVSNAIKFCDRDAGEVAVAARATSEGLHVTVADNGPGIPPAMRARIFERFQQFDSTVADKLQGTGLGLSICRQIIEHFGGRIWVECEPGEGACFHFTVPGAAAE